VIAEPEPQAIRGQILSLGTVAMDTAHGRFHALVGRNLATGSAAFAIYLGEIAAPEPLLVRIHSSCVTSETFGGCDCDCVEQLDAALERIARRGRGIVFYLMQEGRGAGFAAKARDRMLVQASGNRLTTFDAYAQMGLDHDCRRYEEVGDLCHLLGVCAPLTVLTGNPEKLAGLRRDAGLAIVGTEPLSPAPSPWNRHYIAAKLLSGHQVADAGAGVAAAELPETVVACEPRALPGDPRFVHLATYLLPIRAVPAPGSRPAGDPSWFRLYAYADLVSRVDRVVLTFGRDDAPVQLVRVQREALLERFPLVGAERRKPLWHEAMRRIVAHGGCATFLPSTGFDERLAERTAPLEPGIALLAHHLRGRAARLLVASDDGKSTDEADEAEGAAGAQEILARSGVTVLDPIAMVGGTLAPGGKGADRGAGAARRGA
jgi:3,4-dihydroxy 2-butanone 4-phosphate synthase / GTP cyclohydrolase II